LVGQVVVLDMSSPWVYVGRLARREADFLLLEQVDAHDLRDTQTTRERYILESRRHGVQANRAQTWVNLRDVVGVCRLEDVMLDWAAAPERLETICAPRYTQVSATKE
jgi:hypothetical protein